ncbi:MAG: H-NS histone family protein [Methylococcaceae bacterium]|nr:H-NS histone family protein [Methylococcaceae bacterium]
MTEYNNLSETELQAVIDKAESALKEKKSRKRKEVIAQIKELAASIGVTVEIDDAKKPVKKGKKVAAKYCNPDDKSQTWTGRGVSPKWMQALIEAGHEKSDFLI